MREDKRTQDKIVWPYVSFCFVSLIPSCEVMCASICVGNCGSVEEEYD